jgi:hypothetical protein
LFLMTWNSFKAESFCDPSLLVGKTPDTLTHQQEPYIG